MAKYALMVSAGPEELGLASHGLGMALDLHDHGHAVEVFLCGPATKLPGRFARRSTHPVTDTFGELSERGLIVGACQFCAAAYGAEGGCEEAGIDLLGGSERHGPNVGELVDGGARPLTIG